MMRSARRVCFSSLLASLAACSPGARSAGGGAVAGDAKPAEDPNLFAGAPLGATLVADDARFDPAVEGDERRALRAPASFGGRMPSAVFVRVVDTVVAEVEIRFSAQGAPAADELVTWAAHFCTEVGGTMSEEVPSPLGTPPPGETWDPVILRIGRCRGQHRGRVTSIRSEHARTREYVGADVEIRVYAKPPAE